MTFLDGCNNRFVEQAALRKGGEGFATVLHEILHGMGLVHPHDDGGSSSVFPGVTQPFGDFGTDGQNQDVYAIMSYNSDFRSLFPTTITYNKSRRLRMTVSISQLGAGYPHA